MLLAAEPRWLAGTAGLRDNAEGPQRFAAVLTVLLVAGIRNAWDMLVVLVTSSRGST